MPHRPSPQDSLCGHERSAAAAAPCRAHPQHGLGAVAGRARQLFPQRGRNLWAGQAARAGLRAARLLAAEPLLLGGASKQAAWTHGNNQEPAENVEGGGATPRVLDERLYKASHAVGKAILNKRHVVPQAVGTLCCGLHTVAVRRTGTMVGLRPHPRHALLGAPHSISAAAAGAKVPGVASGKWSSARQAAQLQLQGCANALPHQHRRSSSSSGESRQPGLAAQAGAHTASTFAASLP